MKHKTAHDTAARAVVGPEWLASNRDAILRIAHDHGANRVRVVGSVAHGLDGPDSDLDLLLNLDPGTSLLDMVAIKQDIEDILARQVDVMTELSISPYIKNAVLQDAVDL
jgi:predicted nucleotidyltransferase